MSTPFKPRYLLTYASKSRCYLISGVTGIRHDDLMALCDLAEKRVREEFLDRNPEKGSPSQIYADGIMGTIKALRTDGNYKIGDDGRVLIQFDRYDNRRIPENQKALAFCKFDNFIVNANNAFSFEMDPDHTILSRRDVMLCPMRNQNAKEGYERGVDRFEQRIHALFGALKESKDHACRVDLPLPEHDPSRGIFAKVTEMTERGLENRRREAKDKADHRIKWDGLFKRLLERKAKSKGQ